MVVCFEVSWGKRVVYSIWKIYGCLVIGTYRKIRAVSEEKIEKILWLVDSDNQLVFPSISWVVDASFSDCKSSLRLRHVRRVINLGNAELATSFAELKLNDLLINYWPWHFTIIRVWEAWARMLPPTGFFGSIWKVIPAPGSAVIWLVM